MKDLVTAVVLTSPVASNPSTNIIDTTLDSIRFWFPEIDIDLMFDGVRPEQSKMALDYRTFYHRVMLECRKGVRLFPSFAHRHQIGAMRDFIKSCDTPYIFFCEHDTPLVTDEYIPVNQLIDGLAKGEFDFVRFLPEAKIHPEHEHLMCGSMVVNGIPLRKTIQFSARPHLATKKFYERALARFTPCANCFVEDRMHSICQEEPWDDWRMVIFEPSGNAKRSLHLDGRAGVEKFDESQVF